MFGVGGGGGHSKSSSDSSTNVWKPQGLALGKLYDSARDTWKDQRWMNPQFNQMAMGSVMPWMQGLNPYMMQGFSGLMGGGAQGATGGAVDPALRASLEQSLGGGPSNTQRMYQDIVGGEGNTYVDPLVDDMYDQAWKGLDRGAFKNEAARAARTGNMGNYNRQMNNSQYAADTMSDVRSKEMALRQGAYDKDLNWKMNIAQQADNNLGKAQDRAMSLLGAGDQNMANALGQGGMMQQFGMGMMNPWMAMQQFPWQGMANYANIIGGPTILGKSSSDSSAWNINGQVGFM